MQVADAAIIGGTGVGSLLSKLPGETLFVPTREGMVRGRMVSQNGKSVFAVQRHSSGHKTPPHLVNYRAIALAVSSLKVRACFSSAAVGSLNPDWHIGSFVLCEDFFDVSSRNLTLFSNEVVHRSFSHPFDRSVANLLVEASKRNAKTLFERGVYANVNGPRYETPAEIKAVQTLGGNLVGMTAASEAICMREAEVPYVCVAVVTNAAAGMGKTSKGESADLEHGDVSTIMNQKGTELLDLFFAAIEELPA